MPISHVQIMVVVGTGKATITPSSQTLVFEVDLISVQPRSSQTFCVNVMELEGCGSSAEGAGNTINLRTYMITQWKEINNIGFELVG